MFHEENQKATVDFGNKKQKITEKIYGKYNVCTREGRIRARVSKLARTFNNVGAFLTYLVYVKDTAMFTDKICIKHL